MQKVVVSYTYLKSVLKEYPAAGIISGKWNEGMDKNVSG